MATRRPFRFGISTHGAATPHEWFDLVRMCEDLGYASLAIPDHFNEQLAPVPALASAVSATQHLRVGMLVAANDFRHPVVHAKELATIDVVSNGRVDWGVGAGWLAPEYKSAGIPFDRGPVRVDRLAESIAVMKQLFADGATTFEGKHYCVRELDGYPKPVQRPHPPLLIGAAKRRMLRLAGREADIVGIAPMAFDKAGPTVTRAHVEGGVDDQLRWIRDGAGDRFDELEFNMVAFPILFDADRSARAERYGARSNMTPDAVLAAPHVLIGDVAAICEMLIERRERWGVTSWTIPSAFMEKMGPVVSALAGT